MVLFFLDHCKFEKFLQRIFCLCNIPHFIEYPEKALINLDILLLFFQTVRLNPPGFCPPDLVPKHIKVHGCRRIPEWAFRQKTHVRISTPTTAGVSISADHVTGDQSLMSSINMSTNIRPEGKDPKESKGDHTSTSGKTSTTGENIVLNISILTTASSTNVETSTVKTIKTKTVIKVRIVGTTPMPATVYTTGNVGTSTENSVPEPKISLGDSVANGVGGDKPGVDASLHDDKSSFANPSIDVPKIQETVQEENTCKEGRPLLMGF